MTHHDNDRTGGRDTSPHTTTSRPPAITLTGVGDTLAAIPHLLGFHPTDSVVLLSGTERGTPLSRTLRCDLPPEHLVDVVAHDITASLADDNVSSVLLVIVGGKDGCRDGDIDGDLRDSGEHDVPPCARLVEALCRELDALGVTEVTAYWVPVLADGAPYRSYDDPLHAGVMPDPASSLLAAELASRGYVTYGSREELAAVLAPESESRVAHRAELIETTRAAGVGSWPLARRVAAVRDAISAARHGTPELSDGQIATLAIALVDIDVRDACLATALPPDSELAVAAAALWHELTRALPAPERAIPACLAGYAAYMRGDGALAAIAFDMALDADPDHVLAGLLDRALRYGFPPHRLHQLAAHDTVGLCTGAWSLDASA